jgi:hypothetical protein
LNPLAHLPANFPSTDFSAAAGCVVKDTLVSDICPWILAFSNCQLNQGEILGFHEDNRPLNEICCHFDLEMAVS